MQQPKKRKVVCKLFVWFFFNTFYYVGLFYFIFIIPVYSQFANFFFFLLSTRKWMQFSFTITKKCKSLIGLLVFCPNPYFLLRQQTQCDEAHVSCSAFAS